MLRGPRGQTVHFLERAVLFPPHVMNLHGCFTFCNQIQVLLGQVGPQLPDFKLKGKKRKEQKQKHNQGHFRIHPAASISNRVNA